MEPGSNSAIENDSDPSIFTGLPTRNIGERLYETEEDNNEGKKKQLQVFWRFRRW